ncbi:MULTISPECIES: sigma factor-like helix-turn-helix DNA-binding protein [unclassified Streptomyces]|uniref:sigma factor-like helix-turn-helix DNA-binding protein n=1 Tax=unclassified Streptomyces TaxID=2593676 RepID=UPI0006FB98E3|nr:MULTISPECIES: sigma factor-like helix-turn-helix DNA-binding protein [unclassified Streptomyces]KQX58954.1 RNA polymerase [Streptomyces sp. Root1304]KRB00215.1 RNA polymerase [Streptomyces sp. Root66D1]
MGERRSTAKEAERAYRTREFDAFVAGTAGRLLHAATLLTAETRTHNPYAQALLTASLAHTYAVWGRLRDEDPYELTRCDLAARFARTGWRHHGGRGVLAALHPRERLVVVLRLYEGVAEEQLAALLGLPEARVRAVCARSVAALAAAARRGAARPVPVRREPAA